MALKRRRTSITFLGKRWKVRWAKKLDSAGMCDPGKLEIWIKSVYEKQFCIQTMLHEILESLNQDFELRLKHHKIEALSTALLATLSDAGVNLSPLIEEEGT